MSGFAAPATGGPVIAEVLVGRLIMFGLRFPTGVLTGVIALEGVVFIDTSIFGVEVLTAEEYLIGDRLGVRTIQAPGLIPVNALFNLSDLNGVLGPITVLGGILKEPPVVDALPPEEEELSVGADLSETIGPLTL